MSKRNTQEAKRAARERLREEREKAAKRDKMRRQLVIGVVVLAVIGVAALVGMAVANMGKGGDSTDWAAVERQVAGEPNEDDPTYAEDAPAHATGDDGLTVLIGDPDAPHTLTFYEEPRCGGCADFEQGMGEAIHAGIDAGDFNAEYVFGSFFDDNPQVGSEGSKNAISALGAALNVSVEAFQEFQSALYSEEFHTSTNRMDDFADDETMLSIGKSLDALSDSADRKKFEDAVNNSTFAVWAFKMSEKFAASGIGATPAVLLDGEQIETPGSPEMLQAQLNAAAAGEGDTDGDAEGDEGEDSED